MSTGRADGSVGAGREGSLPRRLGPWSLGFVLVGIMVGSGIFRVPSVVAAEVGSVALVGGVWLVGGLLALCGALCYAELAAAHPRPGGAYVYLREAWGDLPAFLYGWIRLVVAIPASLGAVALIFAGYLDTFVPLDEGSETIAAVAALAVFTALNVRSVVWTALVENAASLAKLLALALVAVLVFLLGDPSRGSFAAGIGPGLTAGGGAWAGVGAALTAAMWSYSGWGLTTKLAGEVRDPGRSLPRALFWGVVAVTVVYLAVNAAFLWVLPVDRAAASGRVAAEAASAALGPRGGALVAALVIVSTLGTLNALVLSNARLFYAMAEDGLFFRRVARVHQVWETPHVSTLVVGSLGVLYVSVGDFAELAGAFVLGMWPFHVAVAVGLMRLRRKEGVPEGGYAVPLYPLVPLLFVVLGTGMLVAVTVTDPGPSLLSLGAIASGVPVHAWWTARQGGGGAPGQAGG